MKKILGAALMAGLFTASCENVGGLFKNESADSALVAGALVPRDHTITAEQAYSDLFLDSTALEVYIAQQRVNDTLARGLRNFYNKRNFQYAWFTSEGATEQGLTLWNRYSIGQAERADSLRTDALDTLLTNDSVRIAADDSLYIRSELQITHALLQWKDDAMTAGTNGADLLAMVPVRKVNAMELADSLLYKSGNSKLDAYPAYHQLRRELERQYAAARQGGWDSLAMPARPLAIGVSDPAVAVLKKRLQATGDLQEGDTTPVFNQPLSMAIANFQVRNGLDSTGTITDTLVRLLNISPEYRVKQLLVNLQRMQWMPPVDSNTRSLVVNIPSYQLRAFDSGRQALQMKVVVGKEGSNTLMFADTMTQVVFNPYWNIPAEIVRTEILPAMQRDPAYLKKKGMEQAGQLSKDLPLIRQLPGEQNALGQVKFLFPNPHDIYLHDTPEKSLFSQEQRAFSHGCIRVEDATALADFLLPDNGQWTKEKIIAVMKGNEQQEVNLARPVPVQITYYTVWTDESGRMQYGTDVYGLDARTINSMFS